MEIKNLDEIFESLKIKSDEVNEKINYIKNLDNSKLMIDIDILNKLKNLTDNINIVNDNLEDLKMELLNIQITNLTADEKENLRNYNFQKIFSKTFLPLMLYLRVSMES